MRLISKAVLIIATGLIFWFLFIFLMSLLQLNGLLLNSVTFFDLSDFHVELRDYPWVEIVTAIGTVAAAIAAAAAAIIALVIDGRNRNERKEQEAIKARANRAVSVFALSEIASLIKALSQKYGEAWCHHQNLKFAEEHDLSDIILSGEIEISATLAQLIHHVEYTPPQNAIEMLRLTIQGAPEEIQNDISFLLERLQRELSHIRSLKVPSDYRICGFSALRSLAELSTHVSKLLIWARGQKVEKYSHLINDGMSISNFDLPKCCRLAYFKWLNA
ncbi:hypothetical protein GCM10007094_13900 [Pseudovibrio japonicus]|uniref:Uncharacterized protein n=1 Tax=Pseudovibrio japonicus TaxID=366534 RepID=A0ABQ3ECV7_9HYPH|nr:hypothetical protein [Pseudovibrio japonicus]GHB26818.1 hypothetical protein GCM10007094_13900 [Pseudovibrio japonicus]